MSNFEFVIKPKKLDFTNHSCKMTLTYHLVLCLIFVKISAFKEYHHHHHRPIQTKTCESEIYEDEKTLVLVHALFRHGERTVDPATLYPKDPYKNETYYPYGVGQLTNEGKRREYRLGKALRTRYNNFLGRVYTPDILDATSTEFNRTKMSLELVLAGLFPPIIGDQIFEPGLPWQPVPYNFLPRGQDQLLLGVACPNYKKFYKEFVNSEQMKLMYYQYYELFDYLSEKSGSNITNFDDVFYLYFGLRSEAEWGFELPSWTNVVYPQPLKDLVIQEYSIATGTVNLRKLSAGFLLEKIVRDTTAKIAGDLKPKDRKIFLYSGHEFNIASFLTTLDIFEPKIPSYGCYILMEVHEIDGEFGVKLFFDDYSEAAPKLLKLPNCGEFCPLDDFVKIVEKYFPENDLCGNV